MGCPGGVQGAEDVRVPVHSGAVEGMLLVTAGGAVEFRPAQVRCAVGTASQCAAPWPQAASAAGLAPEHVVPQGEAPSAERHCRWWRRSVPTSVFKARAQGAALVLRAVLCVFCLTFCDVCSHGKYGRWQMLTKRVAAVPARATHRAQLLLQLESLCLCCLPPAAGVPPAGGRQRPHRRHLARRGRRAGLVLPAAAASQGRRRPQAHTARSPVRIGVLGYPADFGCALAAFTHACLRVHCR